jgi:hypothetical protein
MPKYKRPSVTDQIRAVSDWNDRYPVGTQVTVEMDSGEIRATKTRSSAWLLSGHTAVIMLEGITGGYLLSRVRAKGAIWERKP